MSQSATLPPPTESLAPATRPDSPTNSAVASFLEGDSFRLSVVLLVGVAIGQRLIGLVRNVLFCGMLDADELGRWSLASNFLGWAAPFVVLGLPGSFGRLAEHYRARGQFRIFLRRTGVISAGLLLAAVLFHVFFPTIIAKLVFNDPTRTTWALLLGAALTSVVLLNFLTELLISVRLSRAASLVHMTNSLAFTGLGVLFVALSADHEQALIVAFGSSSAIAALVGLFFALRLWRSLPPSSCAEPSREFWRRVVSFAGWIWCANTIANLFDVSDQFVLKHFSHLPLETVDTMLGQLYAARVVPVLIVAVATMVSGSLLPYLIKDAEQGRDDAVQQRMNAVMKFASLGFTLIAALTHLASPILFDWCLRGKYDSGLHLMPWAFVQYTWFSLTVIAGKYLICKDHPRLGLVPLLLSLGAGLVLTITLASPFGLTGVVVAMAIANAIGLSSLLAMTHGCGMHWDRGVYISAFLPLSLSLGGGASLLITIVLLLVTLRFDWLMFAEQRRRLNEWIQIGCWTGFRFQKQKSRAIG